MRPNAGNYDEGAARENHGHDRGNRAGQSTKARICEFVTAIVILTIVPRSFISP
jgi:hypothetical protein